MSRALKAANTSAETAALKPQVNVPIVGPGFRAKARRAATEHELGLSMTKDGELVGRFGGEGIPDEAERVTIPGRGSG